MSWSHIATLVPWEYLLQPCKSVKSWTWNQPSMDYHCNTLSSISVTGGISMILISRTWMDMGNSIWTGWINHWTVKHEGYRYRSPKKLQGKHLPQWSTSGSKPIFLGGCPARSWGALPSESSPPDACFRWFSCNTRNIAITARSRSVGCFKYECCRKVDAHMNI